MWTADERTHDIQHWPKELQMAKISAPISAASLQRLTSTHFILRYPSGSGKIHCGTLEELLPLMQSMSVPAPYKPPAFVEKPRSLDPLAGIGLNIKLDL